MNAIFKWLKQVKITFPLACILGIGSFCISANVQARCHYGNDFSQDYAQKLGRLLATRYWKDVEKQNVEAYSNKIACTFQGLNVDGIYNRDDQINGLMNLTVTQFKLKNLVVADHRETLVISYDLIAQGEGIVSGPSMDTWQRICNEWQLISHSYVPF